MLKNIPPRELLGMWGERRELFNRIRNCTVNSVFTESEKDGYGKLYHIYQDSHNKPMIKGLLSMTDIVDRYLLELDK